MNALYIPVVALFIPIVAIMGGITAGIFRTYGRQRLAELVMKERIAAIEKGLDPSRLPPPPFLADGPEPRENALDPFDRGRRQRQGLLIGGLVTAGSGIGLAVMFRVLQPTSELGLWAIGLVPFFVGVGLLTAAALLRPRRAEPPQG